MKKILLAVAMLFLTVTMAHALGSSSDETIHPPITGGKELIPSSQPSAMTVAEMRAVIKAGTKEAIKASNKVAKDATAVAKESKEVANKAVSVAKESNEVAKKSVKVVEDNTAVMRELTESNTDLSTAVKNVGSGVVTSAKSVKSSVWWLGVAILLALCLIGGLIVVVIISASKSVKDMVKEGSNNAMILDIKNGVEKIATVVNHTSTKVDAIPERTFAMVKEWESPIELTNVGAAGKTFRLMKPQFNNEGKMLTLRVVSGAKASADSPADIPRAPTNKISVVRKDNAEVLAPYVDEKLEENGPQHQIILNAIATGEIEEA